MRYFIVNYIQRMVRHNRDMTPQTDEIVSVSKKLRMKDLQTAAVILDFRTQTVVQSTMNGVTIPKDWQKIRDFYHQHYATYIEELEQMNGHVVQPEAAET